MSNELDKEAQELAELASIILPRPCDRTYITVNIAFELAKDILQAGYHKLPDKPVSSNLREGIAKVFKGIVPSNVIDKFTEEILTLFKSQIEQE